MSFFSKLLVFLGLALLLSSCNALGVVKATSTPEFSTINTIEEIPPQEFEATSPLPIAATQTLKPEKTLTPSATIPVPHATRDEVKTSDFALLGEEIDRITAQVGGRWHIIIKEINGPYIYVRQPDRRINIASIVKVPIALLFFKSLESQGISDDLLQEYIQSRGTGGRTFDQLLGAMLVKSEEDATEILDKYIRSFYNVPAQKAEWELSGMDLVARRYTAAGVASVFERFYQGNLVSPVARELILAYLSEYTSSDEVRIGSISKLLPDGFTIFNKRGSLLTPYVVADCAIIENANGVDYILIMFAYQGEPETTYELLEQAQSKIALAFWQTIKP